MDRDIAYYRDYISDSEISSLTDLDILPHGFRQVKLSHPPPPTTTTTPTTPSVNETTSQHAAIEPLPEDCLAFLAEIYSAVKSPLADVLSQRAKDRDFIDERTKACAALNRSLGRDVGDPRYASVIGQRDADGRVVVGPAADGCRYYDAYGEAVAPLPAFLKGSHVTLFGLSSSEKACSDAMNVFKRKLREEPEVIEEALRSAKRRAVPKWGVDAEDSQPPFQRTFMQANANIAKCYAQEAPKEDSGEAPREDSGKVSGEAPGNAEYPQALAFKRVPGLAIPSTFLFIGCNPYPLHLYDLAVHAYRNWARPEALVFYVPKLENEEEAAYLKVAIDAVEAGLVRRHASYVQGSIRVLVVVENPRAIFRVNEIVSALYPYFAGASLGWHDFLAGTARLFKNDEQYHIPRKSDAQIVIKHVKASHELVARVVGKRGGVSIGGMYGWLPTEEDWQSESFQICIKGYIKNVLSQLKRGLIGFWIPREDYFRVGQALVNAFEDSAEAVEKVIVAMLSGKHKDETLSFWRSPDVASLDTEHPSFARSLIVANIPESPLLPNNDPDEVRLNAFQSIQYLTSWLAGNGCVALPAVVEGVAVRVMDDLATVERSRWEVWHEVHHGRLSVPTLVRIIHEEKNFIRRDLSTPTKRVQVAWHPELTPLATKIFLKLTTDKCPCEFVTEVLLKFTTSLHVGADRVTLDPYVERFDYYFERCGSVPFAKKMAQCAALDLPAVREEILRFDKEAIKQAASFHGDIGKGKPRLDKMASKEQQLVFQEGEEVLAALAADGDTYIAKFGVKFLVAAKGKSGKELLQLLRQRMNNSEAEELENARQALWEITRQRIEADPPDRLLSSLESLREAHKVVGASLCISLGAAEEQCLCLGESTAGGGAVSPQCRFQIASLSKTIASCFCMEYFHSKGISLETSVNAVLKDIGASYRLNGEYGDQVNLRHLMSHAALNMHYVNGIPLSEAMPSTADLLQGNAKYNYPKLAVVAAPGTEFHYSGGGFLLLQHIIETAESKPVSQVLLPFLQRLGVAEELSFAESCDDKSDDMDTPNGTEKVTAIGYREDGKPVKDGRLKFPAFAAGALATPRAVLRFLQALAEAYEKPSVSATSAAPSANSSAVISHDIAVEMVHASDKGCMDFMGCRMGVGVFVVEAGPNRFLVHQGANDGFRAIFLYCFDGPAKHKGVVVCANGDNNAMLFIAKAMRELMPTLDVEGVNLEKLRQNMDVNLAGVPQEEIVNMGYKALLFEAFAPTLPPPIPRTIGSCQKHPMAERNLAAGAKILQVSNQRFARAENVFSPYIPCFDPKAFCAMGKVMDSWETARHNPEGVDFLVARIPQKCDVQYVEISTRYHLGNQVEAVKVKLRGDGEDAWKTAVDSFKLEGHAEVFLRLSEKVMQVEEIMLEIFPDGGLSRVALYDDDLPPDYAEKFQLVESAKSVPCKEEIPQTKKPLQLIYHSEEEEVRLNWANAKLRGGQVEVSSLGFGGSLVSVTNEHYGPAAQVLSPYMPLSMHDGFESARSRQKGHVEELVLRLGRPAVLSRIEFDFAFFVNNNPMFVQVLSVADGEGETGEKEIVPKTSVKAFAGNVKVFTVSETSKVELLKVKVFPDGGINRIRAFADISQCEWMEKSK